MGKQGLLIVVSGFSGTGKGTVLKRFAQDNLAILNFGIQNIIRFESSRGQKLTGKANALAISPCFQLNLHCKTSFVYT